MAQTADQPFTIDRLYDLPDDTQHYEISRGRLVCEPPPGGRHGLVVANLTQLLTTYADQHGNGVVLAGDPGFVLARNPDTLRAPDVAWVAIARYRALGSDHGFLPLAPDLAIEVLSPNTRPGAIRRKIRDYLCGGTRCVWLADPHRREVTCHDGAAEPVVLTASMMLTAPRVLPGLEARVARVFRSPFD